jgi:hypothetical protein
VRVLHASDCFRGFDEPGSEEAGRARTVVAQALGRAPASVTASYSAAAVSLPSGQEGSAGGSTAAPAGFDPGALGAGPALSVGGAGAGEPASVAGARAEAYQVLPGYAGLAQLVGRGSLQVMDNGDFRVRSAIPRYPAGLTGAHAVRFQLAQGVSAPTGAPGHSCVVASAGRAVTNPLICAQPRQPGVRIRGPRD